MLWELQALRSDTSICGFSPILEAYFRESFLSIEMENASKINETLLTEKNKIA